MNASDSRTPRVTPQHLILFRQTLGLTQSEAARMLDVTRVTWNRWENGRTHPPDFLLKVLQPGGKINRQPMHIFF